MKKFLRFSFLSLLLAVCSTAFAQTTFDFDNDYATLFPSLPGTSTNESGDGDFNEATTCTLDGVSVTVSAKDPDNNSANRIWSSTPRLRMYSGTLTITAPEGSNLTTIEFNYGKWNANTTVDKGEIADQGNDLATWTGESNSVVLSIGGNTQLHSLTVYLDGAAPVPAENVKFVKATSVESGKRYLIVADVDGALQVAKPITSNYGYLYVSECTAGADGSIEMLSDNANIFTITEREAGDPASYVITQSDGRSLYQTGTYDSFNVSDEITDNSLWTISANEDSTFTITNISVNKTVQFSEQYSSFGSYADAGTGLLPYLYVESDTATGIADAVVDKVVENENAPVYNLAGQRVSKDTKGIVIRSGKKYLNK